MVSLDRLWIVIYLFDLELPNQSHYSYLGILATSQYDISWHGTMTDSTESVKLEWSENSETSRRHGPDTDSVSITVASLWLNSHNLNSSEELSVESKYLDKGVTGECRTLMSSVIQVRRIKFFFIRVVWDHSSRCPKMVNLPFMPKSTARWSPKNSTSE